MPLFEQIGRTISDVGQGVAKQTRTMTETARLNGLIAEKKRQMAQVLGEMGQDYYLKHRTDPECEERDYINKVNVLFSELIGYQDALDQLNKTEVCSNCGEAITDGAMFCFNCGTPVGKESQTQLDSGKRCPRCGEPIEDDAVFCCSCGARL